MQWGNLRLGGQGATADGMHSATATVLPLFMFRRSDSDTIPRMRIGIAQTNPQFGQRDANLASALDLLASVDAELWVLPEFFSTGYHFATADEVQALAEPVPDGPSTAALAAYAAKHGCTLVAGVPERAHDGRLYNAAVTVGPGGYVAHYRKIHLFSAEKRWFVPGDIPYAVLDVGPARVGTMICFDHLFPESARSLALLGADIIAHPANLILPDLAQRTMMTRAIENGVFTATANRVGEETRNGRTLRYTGQSQIVSPAGQLLARLSPDREEVAVVDIDPADARDKSLTSQNDKLADRRPEMYVLKPYVGL